MPPDPRPIDILREQLAAALVSFHPAAALVDAPAQRLKRYAYEVAFDGDIAAVGASDRGADQGVQAWVAQVRDESQQDRASRHYLVADVVLAAASKWFPEMLGIAARLRSHLSPDEQADVTMLLVTEPGASAAGRVSLLERNEAFAQVLVWTPDVDSRKWPSAADRFVRRLRLGPFDDSAGATGGDLSPVDAVFEGTSLSAEIRPSWRGILLTTGVKEAERARLLLATVDVPIGVPDVE